MEGIAIYASILIITLAQVIIQHYKDVQLRRIVEFTRRNQVSAIRGRDGSVVTIDSSELVVGDIILIQEGMKIPADCILLDTEQIYVDESLLSKSCAPVKKNVFQDKKGFFSNPNPFLFS